jgi:hypothetical protein
MASSSSWHLTRTGLPVPTSLRLPVNHRRLPPTYQRKRPPVPPERAPTPATSRRKWDSEARMRLRRSRWNLLSTFARTVRPSSKICSICRGERLRRHGQTIAGSWTPEIANANSANAGRFTLSRDRSEPPSLSHMSRRLSVISRKKSRSATASISSREAMKSMGSIGDRRTPLALNSRKLNQHRP